MGSPNPQTDLSILSVDPTYSYLQALSAHQQPTRNADILNAMARLLTQQPQPSSTLPHPMPTPLPIRDPYTGQMTSPEQFQSQMGVVQPAMVQPGDVAGMMAGSALTGPGRAVLGSERGAIGRKLVEEGTSMGGRMNYRWWTPAVDDLQLQKLRHAIKSSEFANTELEGPLLNVTKKPYESIRDLHASMSDVLEKAGARGRPKWKVDDLFEKAGLPNRREQVYENWLTEPTNKPKTLEEAFKQLQQTAAEFPKAK